MRWWVYLASASLAAAAFFLTSGQFLYSWDSVNFALGVERLDVGAHRPHPPGYLALVWCARALSASTSVPAALLMVSAAAAALSCIVMWEVGRVTTRSEGAALLGWSVIASSPLLWFSASTAEIYTFELLSSAVCGAMGLACILRPTSVVVAVAMGAALGVAVLVKPSVTVLMLPLWLYVAMRMDATARWRALVAGVAGLGIGGAILVSVVPIQDLIGLTHAQVAATVESDARFDPLRLLNRRVRDVFYALCAALGLGGLVLLAVRPAPSASARHRTALAVWGAPYLVMCIGLHFPKPGYALPLIAPLGLWLAGRNAARSTRACVGLAAAVCALNLAQFTLRPWRADVTGGDKRYAHKTLVEKLATEMNAILRPSVASIETLDGRIAHALTSIPETCRVRASAFLVETGGPVTWRHAMYYLREPLVLQIGQRPDETLAARRGEVIASPPAGVQSRAVECVGLVSYGRLLLAGPSVVQRDAPGETVYWSMGPSTVSWSAADGVVVRGATALVPRRDVHVAGQDRPATDGPRVTGRSPRCREAADLEGNCPRSNDMDGIAPSNRWSCCV